MTYPEHCWDQKEGKMEGRVLPQANISVSKANSRRHRPVIDFHPIELSTSNRPILHLLSNG